MRCIRGIGVHYPLYMARNFLSHSHMQEVQRWALSVFLNFFNNKKWFFCIFYQINNLFLHQSYLKSPHPVKLTWQKMQKNIVFISEKNLKNTSSAQLWQEHPHRFAHTHARTCRTFFSWRTRRGHMKPQSLSLTDKRRVRYSGFFGRRKLVSFLHFSRKMCSAAWHDVRMRIHFKLIWTRNYSPQICSWGRFLRPFTLTLFKERRS